MSRSVFYCRCGARLEGSSARLEHCCEAVTEAPKVTRFPFGRFGLQVDPVGEFVALTLTDRTLLGEVVAVEWREGPPSGFFATVKHFNGEPWPFQAGVAVLEWIKQDS